MIFKLESVLHNPSYSLEDKPSSRNTLKGCASCRLRCSRYSTEPFKPPARLHLNSDIANERYPPTTENIFLRIYPLEASLSLKERTLYCPLHQNSHGSAGRTAVASHLFCRFCRVFLFQGPRTCCSNRASIRISKGGSSGLDGICPDGVESDYEDPSGEN